jgi:hypothetical protein
MVMTNEEWSVAVAYQLGLQIHSHPFPCPANNCSKEMDVFGHHALRCGKGGDWIKRHNRVRDLFFRQCQRADLSPQLEPKNLMRDCGEKCADFGIPHFNPKGQYAAFDVAITDPSGVAIVTKAASINLAAAHEYESKKFCKYASSLKRHPEIILKPLIFESFGASSQKVADTVKFISSRIALSGNKPYNSIINEFYQSISISLQRSNAIMIIKRYRSSFDLGWF